MRPPCGQVARVRWACPWSVHERTVQSTSGGSRLVFVLAIGQTSAANQSLKLASVVRPTREIARAMGWWVSHTNHANIATTWPQTLGCDVCRSKTPWQKSSNGVLSPRLEFKTARRVGLRRAVSFKMAMVYSVSRHSPHEFKQRPELCQSNWPIVLSCFAANDFVFQLFYIEV